MSTLFPFSFHPYIGYAYISSASLLEMCSINEAHLSDTEPENARYEFRQNYHRYSTQKKDAFSRPGGEINTTEDENCGCASIEDFLWDRTQEQWQQEISVKMTERGFPQHAFPCLLHCFLIAFLLSSGSFSHLSFSIFECVPSSGFSRDLRSLIYSCRRDESNGVNCSSCFGGIRQCVWRS